MLRRLLSRNFRLLFRQKPVIMLPVCLLLVVITIFTPPVKLAASTPPEIMVQDPIIIAGPVPGPGIQPAIAPFAISAPFTPSEIRKAYGIDQITDNGTGKTIAIIDAYGDANIVNDLQAFDNYYGLAAPPNFTCYPSASVGTDPDSPKWAIETALDVEWAHAIAPQANILLVVASSTSLTDMLDAVDYATTHGANIVSMSWGSPEFSNETNYDSYFNHPGVTYIAASGDSGAGVSWPAVSPFVLGAGGTTLEIYNDGTYGSETAWSGSGGGQSFYETRPSYQNVFQSSGYRQVPDVAFDADPSTGVLVYYNSGWYPVGGTSLGAPCWAGLYALSNHTGVSWVYSQASNSYAYSHNFHDITSGNNSVPGVSGYSATTGYDMVTGLGSPVFNSLAYGPGTKLVFTTQPSGGSGGTAFGTQPVVTVQDSLGNTVTSSNAPISISITSGTGASGATLSGTTTISAFNGVAAFSGLSVDKASDNYTLTATFDNLTAAVSNPFNISIGPAARLAFTTQPGGSTVAGTAFETQPVVTVQDAGGNTVISDNASVTLAIGNNPSGGTLSGTKTVTASGGLAAFSGLSVDKAGNGYTLTVASDNLTVAASNPFNIVAGAASQLGFITQPSGAYKGLAFGTQPVVAVQDAYGNTVTSDNASVALAIGNNPSGGTLSGTDNVTASGGIAAFSGLSIDKVGDGYTLTAASDNLTSATSNAFDVSYMPPSVTASAADSITTSSATLNGNLTSPGTAASVDVSFEYGTTTACGSTTTVQTMTAAGSFSFNITGLTPGTTYHFRASADGGVNGTALSSDSTFTTRSNATFSGGFGGGGFGGGNTINIVYATLFGKSSVFQINSSGTVQDSFTATSPDGKMSLTIPAKTVIKDSQGAAITKITEDTNYNPPAPPEGSDIIGLAVDFGPGGTTFNPPITFTYHFTAEDLKPGVSANDLTLAFYDTRSGTWVDLKQKYGADYVKVDPATDTITALLPHFTTYAVMGKAAAPSPTPSPSPSPSPSPALSASPSPTASPSPSATVSPTPEASPAPTPSASVEPAATIASSPSISPSPIPEVPASPFNWALVIIIIAAVVVVTTVIVVIRERSK